MSKPQPPRNYTVFWDATRTCHEHPTSGVYIKDCGTMKSRGGSVVHKMVVKCAKCHRRVGKPIMKRHAAASTPPALLPKERKADTELLGVLMFVAVLLLALFIIAMSECFPR